MTCARHYDAATVNLLRQASDRIEEERRRQHRAEMAQELRGRVAQRRRTYADPTQYDQDHSVVIARLSLLWQFEQWITELSPPVVCDEVK